MGASYTIEGGLAGKQRLDVLARVPESRELAQRVGDPGSVVGIDVDTTVLELAGADVEAAGAKLRPTG